MNPETPRPRAGFFKKTLISLGVLFGLLLAAALILPFVIDVDRYRPEITQAINERIQGKITLGKLSLSLWGHIRIQIDGLELKDARDKKTFSVQDAFFHFPLASLVSGSPELILKMTRPEIDVIKNLQGEVNLLQLVRQQPQETANPSSGVPPAEPLPPSATAPRSVELPKIALSARLGVEMIDARVLYVDAASGLRNEFKKLNLSLRDLSLTRPMKFRIWGDLDTSVKRKEGSIQMRGPVELSGTVSPKIRDGNLDTFSTNGKLDLGALQVSIPATFEKPRGVDFFIQWTATADPTTLSVSELKFKLHQAEVQTSGKVTGMNATPELSFQLRSNAVDLSAWNEIIPPLKAFQPTGQAHLEARLTGPTSRYRYEGTLKISGISFKHERLKAKPAIEGLIEFQNEALNKVNLVMRAPGTDLRLDGRWVSFEEPKLDFRLSASSLDLDQLLIEPQAEAIAAPVAHTPKKGPPAVKTTDTSASTGASSSNEALLDPLRKNALFKKTQARIVWELSKITYQAEAIPALSGKLGIRNQIITLADIKTRLFDGSIASSVEWNLVPQPSTYRFQLSIQDLNLKKAMTSKMALFKNTLHGRLQFAVSGSGKSIDSDEAKKHLDLKGHVKIHDARFLTIDIGKMATEAINRALERATSKIPGLSGKKINPLPERSSQYELVASNLTIRDGVFSAPDFVAKAKAEHGLDVRGETKLNLINEILQARWWILDTYNLTRAKDLCLPVAGQQVCGVLAKKGQPVQLPASVGCTLSAPCYDYAEVPEYFLSIVAGNLADAAKTRVQSEIRKKGSEEIKKLFKGIKF